MGSFLEWDDNYSVGDNIIDDQHKKLIKMIADFYEQIGIDSTKTIRNTIDALADYTDYHFRYEEGVFGGTDYPEIEKHKEIHKKFQKEVADLQYKVNNGAIIDRTEVSSMLRHWLIAHIMDEDQKYVSYIK